MRRTLVAALGGAGARRRHARSRPGPGQAGDHQAGARLRARPGVRAAHRRDEEGLVQGRRLHRRDDQDLHRRRAGRRGADVGRHPALDAGQPAADLHGAYRRADRRARHQLPRHGGRQAGGPQGRQHRDAGGPLRHQDRAPGRARPRAPSCSTSPSTTSSTTSACRSSTCRRPSSSRRLNSGADPGAAVLGALGLQRAEQRDDAELLHSGTVSDFPQNKGAEVQVSSTRSLFVASQDFVRAQPERHRRADGGAGAGAEIRGRSGEQAPRSLDLVAEETKQDPALVEAIWGQYVFDPALRSGLCRRHAGADRLPRGVGPAQVSQGSARLHLHGPARRRPTRRW